MQLSWLCGGKWQNAFGINKVRVFTVIFSETELNPPPLSFPIKIVQSFVIYQGFNLKSEVIFYLDMLLWLPNKVE